MCVVVCEVSSCGSKGYESNLQQYSMSICMKEMKEGHVKPKRTTPPLLAPWR